MIKEDAMMISKLPGYNITSDIECILTPNEDGSILIECPSLQLYSSGDTRAEAIENIEENIISLFDDLSENDDFSEDWLRVKSNLLSYMHKA
jgi:predicted RNase H-like HicB family nuclease